MPMPQPDIPQASIIASLFIQAIREGHSLWFRVVSNSMNPLLRLGDTVFIEPAQANEIHIGEIAAFETPQGLVIHRIVCQQQREGTIRLLQMSDVELLASWVNEQAIVGRIVRTRRESTEVDMLHPIAKRCGTVTAGIRYKLYLYNKNIPLRMVLRVCSRLIIHAGYWCIRLWCTSPTISE